MEGLRFAVVTDQSMSCLVIQLFIVRKYTRETMDCQRTIIVIGELYDCHDKRCKSKNIDYYVYIV